MTNTVPPTLRRNASLLRRDVSPAGARRAVFRLVTPTVDRYQTVIEPQGVDLAEHKAAGSPFIWMHDAGGGMTTPRPDTVIGRVVEYAQSPQALDITVEFRAPRNDDDLAAVAWDLVESGHLRAVSIGCSVDAYEVRKVDGRDVTVYTKTRLLEASLVIVPGNPQALRIDRALRAANLKENSYMDKAELAKTLGIGEDADREMAESACMKYLAGDDEAKQAVIKALDEFYPEPAPAAGEPAERAADADDETKTEVEALRAANAELSRALAAVKAEKDAAPKPEQVAAETVKREALIAADVDRWIGEGRVQRSERAKWINAHRAGKAAKVVRHIPQGTWTTSQRLMSGNVGTEIADLPAAPVSPLKREAKALVAQARSMDRSGVIKPAAAEQDPAANVVKSEAQKLVAQARTGLRD